MSRAIDVNQWLEEWCKDEGFTFRKQWESLRKEFRLFFRSVEGGEGIKEGTDEVLVMSKVRQENRISGREKLNIFYTNARSLNNRMEELEAKVDHEEYDIVAVSET